MSDDHHRTGRPADSIRLQLLVIRCQAGDEGAFAALLDEFGDRTMRYLRGMLGDDAEDVQQEVWLAVFRGIARLSNPAAFRTWLFRTTRHRVIDHLRGRHREHQLLDDVAVNEIDVSDDRDDAVDVAEPALAAALAAIPPPQREVLLLRYRDDLKYEEIAVVVGCPIGTVRTRLYHAKRRLRQLLDHEDP
jgi:RNA polymerase sigma-70 factor, ECF subfamily